MAELQKLIQAKGTETSELMKLYLNEAQHSFREHSKTAHPTGRVTSAANIIGSNTYLISNDNAQNGNNINATTGTTIPQQTSADINLNVRPPSSGNLNLTSTGGGDFLNTGSPSSSVQAPSPFFDLSMADLSPLPGGLNLNMGFDNMPSTGDSLNGNTAYSPGNQSLPDNIVNSPMIMPNLDNLDPCSPSEFFTGNMTTTTTNNSISPDSAISPRNTNMNLINTTSNTNTSLSGASVCPVSVDNVNINTNMMGSPGMNANIISQQQQQHPAMLSPNSIKQEPEDTTSVKTDPIKVEPLSPFDKSEIEFYASQNRLSDVDKVLSEAQMTPENSRLLLLSQVTDMIVEAHMGTTINTYANVAAAKERIAGRKLDLDDMIPDISRLSLSASDLWQQFLTALVPEITKVVKFSKKLPGFSDITQTDQIKLIKQGAFEVMVARYSILVDEVNELMLDPKLEMMSPRSVIGDLPLGPFLDEFFVIAKQFNPLCLSDGEIGLFTAVLMICPDREGLDNREAIVRIQDLVLQALYLLMKQNTTRTVDAETTFRSLISMIGHFRKVNDDHARFLNNIKMKSPSDFSQQFPALHQEVFDGAIKKSQEVE